MTLYRVPAVCPECLKRLAFRAQGIFVEWARTLPPQTQIQTIQCPDPNCRTFAPVTAYDLHRAVPARKAA